jgi:tetratricopeptide (TPR) repeat protein
MDCPARRWNGGILGNNKKSLGIAQTIFFKDTQSMNIKKSNSMKIDKILWAMLVVSVFILPVMATDSSDQLNTAGSLYSQSVDLAQEGKYQEALQASDRALALNVTSMVSVIQANRAGILVMLGRFDEAVEAADISLAREGNLTTAHSIAWYNKGNALRSLGRNDEARTAYLKAAELDSTLIPPDLATVTPIQIPTPTKATVQGSTVLVALSLVSCIWVCLSQKRK